MCVVDVTERNTSVECKGTAQLAQAYLTSLCLQCNTYGTNSAVILFVLLWLFFLRNKESPQSKEAGKRLTYSFLSGTQEVIEIKAFRQFLPLDL